MSSSITIPRRFCGPPDSANGGYTAGVLAQHIDGPAEVTLRRPPPLDRPLSIEREDDRVTLRDGADLVAEASSTMLDLEPPPPIDPDAADAADAASLSSPFHDFAIHPFPTCFTCGPGRAHGDGLRLFAGRVPGSDLFAALWTPNEVHDEIVWAALDCPSCAVIYLHEEHPAPHVLGRIAAQIHRPPVSGTPHVLMSWQRGQDGRKVHSASAIYDPSARLCAVARATWIRLGPLRTQGGGAPT